MPLRFVDRVHSAGRAASVRVHFGDADPWLFEAFDAEAPLFFGALDERHVIVVGEAGGIGLFDAEKRTAIARQKLPMVLEHCMLTRDRGRLVATARDAVCVIDPRSLRPLSVVDGLQVAPGSRIGLRGDGRLVVAQDGRRRPDRNYGVYLIEPERDKVEIQYLVSSTESLPKRLFSRVASHTEYSMPAAEIVARFAEPLVWISPDGEWGLRRSYGSMPLKVGEDSFEAGIAVEIWNIAPTQLAHRPCVRMFDEEGLHGFLTDDQVLEIGSAAERSACPTAPDFPLPRTPDEAQRLQTTRERWTGFLARLVDVLWEADGGHAWLAFSDGCLRRIGPDGATSPLYEFLPDILEHRFGAGLRAGSMRYLEDGRIAMEVAGFGQLQIDPRPWLDIPVPADATVALGPMIDSLDPGNAPPLEPEMRGAPPEPGAAPPRQEPAPPSRAGAEIVVAVGEAMPDNCVAAIEKLAALIRDDLPGLVRDGFLLPRFDTPDGQLDEAAFFERVRGQGPNAIPALRSLVEGFVQRIAATAPGPAERIWGDERGTSALAHAARALALMDRGSMAIFDAFVAATSQQYDEFLWNEVVPELFETHGWPDREMLRWGIVFVLRDLALGIREEGRLLERADLMAGAQRLVSPGEFADMLFAAVEDEEFIDDGSRRDEVLASFLLHYLEPLDDFRVEVRGLLKARFEHDFPGAMECLDELSRHFSFEGEIGRVVIPVPDLTEAGHIAAIQTLTGAIDRDLGAMVREYFFAPVFRTPDGMLGEAAFFESVRVNAPAAGPALRTLILTYAERVADLELSSVAQLYGGIDEATGALSHAMHALSRMDDDCVPALFAFLKQTDLSHENYLAEQILPEFIERTNWKSEGSLELGIYLIGCGAVPARGYLWRSDKGRGDWDLRGAVQSRFTPRQFAEHLIAWLADGPAPEGQDFPSAVYRGIENFIWAQAEADNEYDVAVVEVFLELTNWKFLQRLGCRLIQRGDMPPRGNIWRSNTDQGDWNLREGVRTRFEPEVFARFFISTINKGRLPKEKDVLPELDDDIRRFMQENLAVDDEFDREIAEALVTLRPGLAGT